MAKSNPTPPEGPEAAHLHVVDVQPPAPSNALPYQAQAELAEIQNIVGLLTFATEARRILREISFAADNLPQIGEPLSAMVELRNQWGECPQMEAAVLQDVYERLGAMLIKTDY